jgi:hypothetical protein
VNFVPPICLDTAAHANGTLLSGLAAGIGNGCQRTGQLRATGVARPPHGARLARRFLDERESRHAFRLRASEEGTG